MMNSTNKKRSFFIISIIMIVVIIVTLYIVIHFLNSVIILAKGDDMSELESMSTNELVEDFDTIVNMINDGDLYVNSNGCIVLPDNYEYLSDSGECFIVKFDDKTAIEFFLYRGILNSGSKSYIYITNKLSYDHYINSNKYNPLTTYIIIDEITANLFLCSVDS